MYDSKTAGAIIESLRRGVPPKKGVRHYSTGHDKLLEGIRKSHLERIGDYGIIRFISGSWGAGKTHLFRELHEIAFESGCLVSNVELSANESPLNKFERVFYSILRNIVSPNMYARGDRPEAAPFGEVISETLAYLVSSHHELLSEFKYDEIKQAEETLMSNIAIDIDFKKMVKCFWETFLADSADRSVQQQTRDEILQWFGGEGTAGQFRKHFGVGKIVNRDNAKVMLQSLAAFVKMSGYRGLVILFDEAEQSYSIMRKAALRDAQNNLLSLINNVESLPGLFLIYATTPDFYTDERHGIKTYGALYGRIGEPADRPPRYLETVWNLDAMEPTVETYQETARKIRQIYCSAYTLEAAQLPGDSDLNRFIDELFDQHPDLSSVRFWRVLVTSLIVHFEDHLEGDVRATAAVYDDVMNGLRES